MNAESLPMHSIKQRSDLHVERKLYHALGIAIVLVLYYLLTRKQALVTLTIVTPVILITDYWRLRSAKFKHATIRLFGKLMRTEEIGSFSSMSYMVIGVFIVIALFPRPVGALALILFGVGDPAASIFGVLYGKDKIIGNKTLQGAIAAYIACFLAAALYFTATGLLAERWILASLTAGLIGTLSELMPFGKLDDNLTFPVVCAGMLLVMFRLLGGAIGA